jgi:trimeric autotransporter adhesin
MNSQFVPNLRVTAVLAALCGSALHLSAADPITGNLSVTGNLDIQGPTASFGTSNSTTNVPGYLISYTNGTPASIDFSAYASSANWTWSQNSNKPQFRINSGNALALYNSANDTIGVTLNPAGESTFLGGNVGIGTNSPSAKLEVDGNLKITGNGSVITLPDGSNLASARTNALYTSNGTVVASVAPDGKINFANGITIGANATASLTANSTAYLAKTLENLGFIESPSSLTPTPIKQISTNGRLSIFNVKRIGDIAYIVGNFSGLCSINGVNLLSAGNVDGFVAKINLAGSYTYWAKAVGGLSSDYLRAVAIDSAGNVAVVGYSTSAETTNLPYGKNISFTGETDGLVIKYDSDGNFIWANPIGGPSSDNINSVGVDSTGNIYIAGSVSNFTTNLPATLNLTSPGGSYGAIIKYDPQGVAQWARYIGGGMGAVLNSIAVDNQNNIIAAGTLIGGSTTSLPSGYNRTTAGGYDGLIVKYNSSGDILWTSSIGGASTETFTAVGVDAANNIYAAGTFWSTTTNLPPANSIVNAGSSDAVVLKFSSAGTPLWSGSVGGAGSESAVGLAIDGSQNVIMCGQFSSTPTTTLPGGLNLSSKGGSFGDGFMVKWSSAGVPLSNVRLGNDGTECIYNMAVGASDILICGEANLATTSPVGGGSFAFGDKRVPRGSFLLSWSGFEVITPQDKEPASLSWGASIAGSTGTALGAGAYASGVSSVALGSSTSTGSGSFSTGTSVAKGSGSIALGMSALASGMGANAVGYRATATGNYATALSLSYATGTNSFANGSGSWASGSNSFVSGYNALAAGSYSRAFGDNLIVTSYEGTAFGSYLKIDSMHALGFGRYNVAQGNATTWIPTDDIMVVGNGDSDTTRSNALTVHKNGNVRVAGTVQAKGGFRTPPMGDIGMGSFTAGPVPGGHSATAGSNPATLNAGLRYSQE